MLTKFRIATAGIALASFVSITPAQALDSLTIASGPAGTLYHQMATTFTTVIQEKTGTPGSARPFTGTTNYIPMLHLGQIEAGINSSLESRDAIEGAAPTPRSSAISAR